jgi:hypothetical protein
MQCNNAISIFNSRNMTMLSPVTHARRECMSDGLPLHDPIFPPRMIFGKIPPNQDKKRK